LNPYDIINAVFWLGVSGGALAIGSLIAIFVQRRKCPRGASNLPLPHFGFDEFYDASDNISFEKMQGVKNNF
jgi:hypothetical protein